MPFHNLFMEHLS